MAGTEVSGFLKHLRSQSRREGHCWGRLLGQYCEPARPDTLNTAKWSSSGRDKPVKSAIFQAFATPLRAGSVSDHAWIQAEEEEEVRGSERPGGTWQTAGCGGSSPGKRLGLPQQDLHSHPGSNTQLPCDLGRDGSSPICPLPRGLSHPQAA